MERKLQIVSQIPINKKPKLLSINNYHYRRGGSDAVYLDHDKMFVENGWSTAHFSMSHPKNTPSPWSNYFVDELEFGNTYGLLDKILNAGKVIYSLEARNKLSRLLNDFRPDIAHLHCIYHHLSPSILSLLRNNGIPCVMTAHDLKLACPAYKMLNKNGICEKCKEGNLLHLIQNRCIHNSLTVSSLVALESGIHRLLGLYNTNIDLIITPSIFFRNKLNEWGWDMNKLVYVPNFINSNEITPEYRVGSYYLYFGRLAPEKGIGTLISAAIKTNIKLVIVGTGPSENELKQLAQGHDNITFTGYQAGEKLRELITNSKIIVLPSEWYENAPISILEAYSYGKPVIGADIGGIPEMLQNEVTGLIFESGNTEDLIGKIIDIENTPISEIESLGRSARAYVSQTFTADRYYNDMISIYSSLGINTTE